MNNHKAILITGYRKAKYDSYLQDRFIKRILFDLVNLITKQEEEISKDGEKWIVTRYETTVESQSMIEYLKYMINSYYSCVNFTAEIEEL